MSQERELGLAVELRPVRRMHRSLGVERLQDDPAVIAGAHFCVSAEADGCIKRLCGRVKKIQRPDIQRAAGKIDSRRRGRGHVHDGIIVNIDL
jgi:hypothetical protein